MQKLLPIAIIVALAIAGGAWYYFSGNQSETGPESTQDPVARVNGEDVSRSDFETVQAQLASQQGADLGSLDAETRASLQTQALDILVSQVLLRQAVEASGVSASEADIDSQISDVQGQFEDTAAFEEALSAQGLTESELRTQIATDIETQAYLAETLDFDSLEATDEEIQAAYDQAAQTNDELPPIEEVRDQIAAFVVQQKQQQLLNEHVEGLRAEADIEILI